MCFMRNFFMLQLHGEGEEVLLLRLCKPSNSRSLKNSAISPPHRGETSINSHNFPIRDLYRCLVWLNVTARQSHLLNLHAEQNKFEFWRNHKFLAPSKIGLLTTHAWCALCCDFLGFCVQLQPNSASATDRRGKVPLDSKMQFREVLIGV